MSRTTSLLYTPEYKFCSIRINVTKYDVTFVTKGGSNPRAIL